MAQPENHLHRRVFVCTADAACRPVQNGAVVISSLTQSFDAE